MEHIHLNNCTLQDTNEKCPSCGKFLEKIVPLTTHPDFTQFFVCRECYFIGCSNISQTLSAYKLLKQFGVKLINFSATSVIGKAPLSVTFKENNFNLIATDWIWNFGDGGTDEHSDEVTYTYSTPGIYDVSLNVFEYDYGWTEKVRSGLITVL